MAFGGSEITTTPTPSDELKRLEKLNADIAALQKENILLQQQFQENELSDETLPSEGTPQ